MMPSFTPPHQKQGTHHAFCPCMRCQPSGRIQNLDGHCECLACAEKAWETAVAHLDQLGLTNEQWVTRAKAEQAARAAYRAARELLADHEQQATKWTHRHPDQCPAPTRPDYDAQQAFNHLFGGTHLPKLSNYTSNPLEHDDDSDL